MNPVHLKKSLGHFVARLLTIPLLVALLAACGSNAVATPSGRTSPGSTATKPASAALSLSLNPTNISAKAGGLLVQSNDGFQCPYQSLTSPDQDLELGHLVLTSDLTSYSQAEIEKMRSYLTSYIQDGGVANGKILSEGIQPPPTLRWVSGGGTTAIPGASPEQPGQPSPGCSVTLTLTNAGTMPIQIPKVSVRLKAPPQSNSYQYRLIDICSTSGLNLPYCPITGSAGGGSCSIYYAAIHLGAGKQNDMFSTSLVGNPGCSATIPPTTQITLNLTFSLPTSGPQSLIYSIEPVFTVETTQGYQQVALPQLASTLVFASASQFSCYSLQGTTFVLLKSPSFGSIWCL